MKVKNHKIQIKDQKSNDQLFLIYKFIYNYILILSKILALIIFYGILFQVM